MDPKKEFLQSEELWVKDLRTCYPTPNTKSEKDYRNYHNPERDTVREFYGLNHQYQPYEFVLKKERKFKQLNQKSMTFWEAVEFLSTLFDHSDPVIELNQDLPEVIHFYLNNSRHLIYGSI